MRRLFLPSVRAMAVLVLVIAPASLWATTAAPRPAQGADYLIEAAYPAWRRTAYPVEEIPFAQVSRVSHAAVWPDVDGSLVVPDGLIMPELLDAAHAAGREVVLVVGGAARYHEFAAMAASASARDAFVHRLVAFLMEQGYDGAMIDWEFPQSLEDRDHLTALMAALHRRLVAEGREPRLTLCVPSSPTVGQWIDSASLLPLVDYWLVLAHTQYGPTSATSGHSAALYPPPGGEAISVDTSVRYWSEERGVPPARILLGVPFYGNAFDSEDLHQPFTTFSQAYYRDIAPLVGQGFTRHWDAACRVPYLTEDDGPLVWSYDDAESIGAKCDYVRQRGLAGVAIWDISGDLPADGDALLPVIADRLWQGRDVLFVPFVARAARRVEGWGEG